MRFCRRKITIGLCAATTVALVGLSFAPEDEAPGLSPDRPKAASTQTATATIDTPSEMARFEHSERGAREAALYLMTYAEVLIGMDPLEAGAWQRSVSTERSADRSVSELAESVARINGDATDLSVQVVPVMIRSLPFNDGWKVDIWHVQVVREDGFAAAQWVTVTYTLAWERGAWRMDEVASTPGPTPASFDLHPWSPPDRLGEELAEFDAELPS